MTHIELKKYFDNQRETNSQLKTMLIPPSNIAKKVYWEKNQYITHNPKVAPEQIITKTSTDKFPCDATTVRFHSIKHNNATAYIYGKEVTRNYGNNQTWTFPSSKLTVSFPNVNPSNGRKPWGYLYQGNLHDGKSRQEVDVILDYIEDVLSDFLNL